MYLEPETEGDPMILMQAASDSDDASSDEQSRVMQPGEVRLSSVLESSADS
jgi:hypothetical protein